MSLEKAREYVFDQQWSELCSLHGKDKVLDGYIVNTMIKNGAIPKDDLDPVAYIEILSNQPKLAKNIVDSSLQDLYRYLTYHSGTLICHGLDLILLDYWYGNAYVRAIQIASRDVMRLMLCFEKCIPHYMICDLGVVHGVQVVEIAKEPGRECLNYKGQDEWRSASFELTKTLIGASLKND